MTRFLREIAISYSTENVDKPQSPPKSRPSYRTLANLAQSSKKKENDRSHNYSQHYNLGRFSQLKTHKEKQNGRAHAPQQKVHFKTRKMQTSACEKGGKKKWRGIGDKNNCPQMTASWNPLTPSCWGRLFNVLLRGPLGIAIHYRWADEVHRWAFEVRTS